MANVPRAASIETRDNGITAARLGLALMVVVSHSFTLGGFGAEPLSWTGGSAGFVAVIAFFALSGYLLAGSKERLSTAGFVRNRLLRVMPGYWLALVYAAALSLAFGSSAESSIRYVVANLAMLPTGTPATEAFGGWPTNGSLWTLRVEMLAYGVMVVIPRRWMRPVAIAELVLIGGVVAVTGGISSASLLLAFVIGVCAYLWKVPLMIRVGLPAAAVGLVIGWPVAPFLIAYGGLTLVHLPLRMRTDLSYGVYVLAYPTQLAIASFAPSLPIMIAASVGFVLPLAWLSWTFVESPALRLRSRAHAQVRPEGATDGLDRLRVAAGSAWQAFGRPAAWRLPGPWRQSRDS